MLHIQVLLSILSICQGVIYEEIEDGEDYGIKYADNCEVCKIVSLELTSLLDKRHHVRESELVDASEGLCSGFLMYKVHTERSDWTRFARGSQGMEAESADHHEADRYTPPAELLELKTQCEVMLEAHEDDVKEWYLRRRKDVSLEDYLCLNKAKKAGAFAGSCLKAKSKLDKKAKKGNTEKDKKAGKKKNADKKRKTEL